MNQQQRLLDYLQRYESITPLEALTTLGIGRLAARVHELRGKGYSIESQNVTVPTRNGKATVARYRFLAPPRTVSCR